jgi:hypothetical protein
MLYPITGVNVMSTLTVNALRMMDVTANNPFNTACSRALATGVLVSFYGRIRSCNMAFDIACQGPIVLFAPL